MLRYITLLVFCLSLTKVSAQQALQWVKSIGGIDDDGGRAIYIDKDKNVLVTGYFDETVDFDPGLDSIKFSSVNYDDPFIMKLDSNGNVIWAKQLDGYYGQKSASILSDDQGNVFVFGGFIGTVDFNPGAGDSSVFTSSYSSYLLKLDTDGNFEWVKTFITNGQTYPGDFTIDSLGNLYTTGYFRGNCNFAGVSANSSSGASYDMYVAKHDPNGNALWVEKAGDGSSTYTYGRSIEVDHNGNVYTTGSFHGSVNFGPQNETSGGYYDVYILKLDPNGSFTWVKTFSGKGNAGSRGGSNLKVDNQNDIYVIGYYTDTTDFDPGAGTTNLVSNGSYDMFLEKLDSNGQMIWVRSVGGSGFDGAGAIYIDNDYLYIGGYFSDSANFDSWGSPMTFRAAGNWDAFIEKLDLAGNIIWVKPFGGNDDEAVSSIHVDKGQIYSTGVFSDTCNFDPGRTDNSRISNGEDDIFIAKHWECAGAQVYDTVPIMSCDSLISPSNNMVWYSSGYYPDTLFDKNGCDSIITVNLTIKESTYYTDTLASCDSISWINGVTYTSSNNSATHIITNSIGCDSIITLNLTITNSTLSTDVQTICDSSYTWIDGNSYTSSNNSATHMLTNAAGCDSIVTLNLTVLNSTTGIDVYTACDSYTWIDGNIYTSNNNSATHTLANAAGCDSIVMLNLTINPNINTTIDTTLLQGETITVGGNSYNEEGAYIDTLSTSLNCDSIITLNLTVTLFDGFKPDFGKIINLYPNPNNGRFTFEVSPVIIGKQATIINFLGEEVSSFQIKNKNSYVDIEVDNGVYFIILDGVAKMLVVKY